MKEPTDKNIFLRVKDSKRSNGFRKYYIKYVSETRNTDINKYK